MNVTLGMDKILPTHDNTILLSAFSGFLASTVPQTCPSFASTALSASC